MSSHHQSASTCKGRCINGFKRIVLPITLVFALEPFYRQQMYEQTLEDVPNMQELTKLKSFFALISVLGSQHAVIVQYVAVFNLMPKAAALYFWTAMATVYFMGNALSSLYAKDRPYWTTDDIKGSVCSLGFANPSSHLLNNTFFWTSLYLHAYNEVGVKYPRMSVFCTAYIVKMAATCLGIVFIIFSGFARVYLGVQSYNQVMFGTMMGAVFALVGHYTIKPVFLNLPESLYSDRNGSAYDVRPSSYCKALTLGLFMPMALMCSLLLMGQDRAYYYGNEFRYRQTNAGCTIDKLRAEHMLHYLHLQRCGAIAMAAGAFAGQFFEYSFFVNTGKIDSSQWHWYRWYSCEPLKIALRILITALVLLLCFVPTFFAESVATSMTSPGSVFNRALVHTVLGKIIPYFASAFVAFGLLRYLFYKLKLDNVDVRGKEFQTREEYLREIGLELIGGSGSSSLANNTKQSRFEDTIELETR